MFNRQKTEVRIQDVEIVATLGEGSQGTVWSARRKRSRSGGKRPAGTGVAAAPFALKQRLIKKNDAALKDTRSSSALRELEFYRRVANKYTNQFSKLYDYQIREATDEEKEVFRVQTEGGTTRAGRESLRHYTHMFTTLSERKEGVLKNIYRTLDRGQWLSMLSQVCYAIALIHDRGFSHGDVWEANVSYMKAPAKNTDVQIYRTTVPALGYIWSIIDYGSVELKIDETEQDKNKKRASSYELDDMISLASGEDDAEYQCGTRGSDVLSAEFKKRVLSSLDGPSVRAGMRKTGLPLHSVLALINLDSYLWHVCGMSTSTSGDAVKQWINRNAILQMADVRASYASLAQFFARLTREHITSTRRGSKR